MYSALRRKTSGESILTASAGNGTIYKRFTPRKARIAIEAGSFTAEAIALCGSVPDERKRTLKSNSESMAIVHQAQVCTPANAIGEKKRSAMSIVSSVLDLEGNFIFYRARGIKPV